MTTTTDTKRHPRDDRSQPDSCPSWCTDVEGHDAGQLQPGNGRVHLGPEFGPFRIFGYEDGGTGVLEVLAHISDSREARVDLTPAELRQLAADAIAAAEWLEAQK
jgi:hypothetical protein